MRSAVRVLITGVSGFVGRRLAAALLARGDRVAGTYVHQPPRIAGVELHEADIRDPTGVAEAVRRARPDAIVHLAALSHVGASWDRRDEYEAVNVGGTEVVLVAAGAARVVFASSAEVYGAVPEAEQPISETRAPAPASPYASTKAAAERSALDRGAVVVRSFNQVGPGQAPTFALPSFAAQLRAIAATGRPGVIEVGNLEARRDFLHVDDGVAGFLTAIDACSPGEIYNLGSGRAVSIAEALDLLIEISGQEVEIRTVAERWRPLDLPLLLADAGRLRALGWAPRRSFEEALEDLYASVEA